jgi:hypothetical protein
MNNIHIKILKDKYYINSNYLSLSKSNKILSIVIHTSKDENQFLKP